MAVVKSVEIDLSVRGDTDSKAKLDAISLKADELRKAFGPAYGLKIDSAAATAKLAVFREDFRKAAAAITKPQDMQVLTGKAMKSLLGIQATAEELKARFPEFTIRINDKVAKAELDLFAAEARAKLAGLDKEIAGAGGGGGPAGGGAAAASSGGGVLTNPYVITGAIAAGLAALPFAAQAAAGGIVFALGGAMAAIAIYGASKSKEVVKSFDTLKTSAQKDLTAISAPWVPVLNSILGDATSVLGKLTPVFAGAEKTIAGPFQVFSSALLKTFDSPAVKSSIAAVAGSFGKLLTALSPSLAGDMNAVASGITKVANAVAANPKAFSAFISFLSDTVGGTLTAIASLTGYATYVERHFVPAFVDAGADITGIWNTLWLNTVTRLQRGIADIDLDLNNWRHAQAVTFDGIRHDTAAAWNLIWSDSISRIVTGIGTAVSWFRGLPGKVTGALSVLGSDLSAMGRGAMSSLLSGLASGAGGILSWLGNFAKSVLNAIGSKFGIHFSTPSVSTVFHQVGAQIMQGMINGIESKTNAAVSAAAAAAAKVASAGAGSAQTANAAGGAGGSVEALMKSMAAARGWTGALWNDLYAVEMAEAGFNLNATNPSSGAYGLAQFINGPSEYAQYGGNSATAAGQITGMLNYIAQRYGTPAGAWAHEQAYHWYGSGTSSARPGWAVVGERGPELLKLRGGEQIRPAQAVAGSGARGGGAATLQIEWVGDSGGDDLLRWIRKNVRVHGGGNVQRALGRALAVRCAGSATGPRGLRWLLPGSARRCRRTGRPAATSSGRPRRATCA